MTPIQWTDDFEAACHQAGQAQAEEAVYILVDHMYQRHSQRPRKAGRCPSADHRGAYPYA